MPPMASFGAGVDTAGEFAFGGLAAGLLALQAPRPWRELAP